MWFFVPLLPVSHVLFPLQNLMADRYLLFSVGAIALLAGYAAARPGKLPVPLWASVLAVSFVGTAYRASLFSDSRAVFADAVEKTTESPVPPYQLAQAFEASGDDAAAMDAYVVVLARQPGAHETSRRATNNLARLRARHGDPSGAEAVLRRGRTLWPQDPKILSNLARILSRVGRQAEADVLFEELRVRHPGYGAEASAAEGEGGRAD
jgi:TolA-binding protein